MPKRSSRQKDPAELARHVLDTVVIRKHVGATAAGLEQFVQNQADLTLASRATGRSSYFKRYAPGTILAE